MKDLKFRIISAIIMLVITILSIWAIVAHYSVTTVEYKVNVCEESKIEDVIATTTEATTTPVISQFQQEEIDKYNYEKSKADWLKANPAVKELFNEDKKNDTEYVIEYLKKNPIAGDCALVWRPDVVCASVSGASISFPTNRESITGNY
jgi:hypothetical protein